jgi:hypothetical protein
MRVDIIYLDLSMNKSGFVHNLNSGRPSFKHMRKEILQMKRGICDSFYFMCTKYHKFLKCWLK